MSKGDDTPVRSDLAAREVDFFDNQYEHQAYNLTGWELRMKRDLRVLLRERGPRSLGRVLSVGCGDGRFELMMAGHARHVTGIDLSPQAIRAARSQAESAETRNVDFVQASVSDLEVEHDFDAVLCISFLHHLPELECRPFLERMYEHLAPGGLLYTLDPNVNGWLRKVGRVVLGERYHHYHSPDERELDPPTVARQLREVGFTRVRIEGLDLTLIPATWLLAGRPGWPLHICAGIDRLFARTPLARWSSGFAVVAHKEG